MPETADNKTEETTQKKTAGAVGANDEIDFQYFVTHYKDGRYTINGAPLDDKKDDAGNFIPSIDFTHCVADIISLGNALDEEAKAERISAIAVKRVNKRLDEEVNNMIKKQANQASENK